MNSSIKTDAKTVVDVRNIGGIDSANVALRPGVSVLEGRNATNRTSLLRSIIGGLGGDDVALKGDAEEGEIRLEIDGETYTRRLVRSDNAVDVSGDPYLSDSTQADLFAFLLENNEARQAVAGGANLRDVVMCPIDTDEIEREIDSIRDEKSRVTDEIEMRQSKRRELPELERELASLEDQLETKRAELSDVNDELASLDITADTEREQREVIEEQLAELNEARGELETTRRRLDSEREQLDALKEERDRLRREREDIPTSVQEISDIGERIGVLQERKRSLDSSIDRLQSVIQFNREVLEDRTSDIRTVLVEEEHLTDQLLAGDDELLCWTCGSRVTPSEIEDTLADLRELREEKTEERRGVNDSLAGLKERRQEFESYQQRREQIDHRVERIDDRLKRSEERTTELREKHERAAERVENAEAAFAELDRSRDDSRVLELNKRANELESAISDLESERTTIASEIENIEEEVDELSRLEDDRAEMQRRTTELRNRVDTLESNAVSAFNEHIDTVLTVLEYENIERIWIERKKRGDHDGSRSVESSVFEIHVVRSTDDGAAYEDTIDHLSESEREVTGLVFALAGYLVHDVYETVPFMLLDSLEAIDSPRISKLVNYFEGFAPYLVVALLPEDARALNDEYDRITSF